MRSTTPMKIAKAGYICMSVIMAVLGICLICIPDVSADVIGIVCGILMIVFGIFKLVGYFSKDLFRLAFQYDLAFGILSILLGIVLIIRPWQAVMLICILLGISVLSDGLFKIQIAIDAKRFGVGNWWMILAFALLAGIFGFLLIMHPDEGLRFMTVIFGITLLSEGILNICTVISVVKIIKNQKPDYIEVNFEEREDK